MKRIAIISHTPIRNALSGKERVVKNIAKLIKGNDTEIEIFSLSQRNHSEGHGAYVEHEIKSANYTATSRAAKLTDSAMMVILGTRPILNAVNSNKKFISAIEKFDPDVIICETFVLPDMLKRLASNAKKKVKIITTFDSYMIIYNYASSIFGERPGESILKSIPKKMLARRYIQFNLGLYRETLKMSDIHVVYTEKDKSEVEEFFSAQKPNVMVLPGQFLESKRHGRRIARTSINNILFIGSYLHLPNRDAMRHIEFEIAPLLKDKKFIIAGGNCPKKIIGNVHYVGTVPDIRGVLNKADLCIAPLSSGTGLKVKMLDYFSAGKAVVGTSIAFEGYDAVDSNNALIEDDINKYAGKIRVLEKNTKLFLKIQKNSVKIASRFEFRHLRRRWRSLVF